MRASALSDRRVLAGVIGAVAVAAFLAILSAVVARTLLPYEVEGLVVAVQERNRDPGTEVWLVTMGDGRLWFVDEAAARALRPGLLRKSAWSPTVRVGDRERTIGLTRDVVGPALWGLGTAVACVAVAARRARRPEDEVPARPSVRDGPAPEPARPPS